MYPGRQVHVELPGVLMQAATGLHPPLFTAHSLTSALSQDEVLQRCQWREYFGEILRLSLRTIIKLHIKCRWQINKLPQQSMTWCLSYHKQYQEKNHVLGNVKKKIYDCFYACIILRSESKWFRARYVLIKRICTVYTVSAAVFISPVQTIPSPEYPWLHSHL